MAQEDSTPKLEQVFLHNAEMVLDAKLRVGIPERFMKVLKSICPEHADKVGVIPTTDRSLKVLPYSAFLERVEEWKGLNDRRSDHRTIKNLETSLAAVITLDAQNRFRLTPAQVKFCKIKSKVLIVGRVGSMEIFDPTVFDKVTEKAMENFDQASDAVANEKAGLKPAQKFVIQAQASPAP